MNKYLAFGLLALIFIFLLGNANAYTNEGTYFACVNCSDCTDALNDNALYEVRLTASITNQTGTCIDNPANFINKTFDCQGFTIDGDDDGNDRGIYLEKKKGNTIKNCIITDFYHGIFLYSSSNNNALTNNTVNTNVNGIYLFLISNNNTLTNNTVNNNTYYGITPDTSSNNNLINNTANNNARTGIYLNNADNNNFTSNIVKFNQWHGLYAASGSTGNIINTNIFCSNNQSGENYYDIYDGGSTTGDNNTFCSAHSYYDTGESSSHPMTYDECGGDCCFPVLAFVSPTPANNTTTNKTNAEINISITEQNLDTFIFNWNGTNTTYNVSQLNG
ncbi:MAG: hypothetical protein CVU81_01190, partial [Euryarchaeota archaeon HGW-Euryarchaeota-1]